MPNNIPVTAPEVGDLERYEVVEIHVAPGDRVAHDQLLVSLESDKTVMEVVAPHDGIIRSIEVQGGADIDAGAALLFLAPSSDDATHDGDEEVPDVPAAKDRKRVECEVVVIGAGPGGYTAAFRASDLGMKTVLIERHRQLGGVCLNVGCIPSKALLHAAKLINDSAMGADMGIDLPTPGIRLQRLREWKNGIVQQLSSGIGQLAKKRRVDLLHGEAQFRSSYRLDVENDDGTITEVHFQHAIIATGSRAIRIPDWPWSDPRMMDSSDALELTDIPQRLLIVGAGAIGLEMATVYQALGSQVSVVELQGQLLPGCDKRLVQALQKQMKARGVEILLKTGVSQITPEAEGMQVWLSGKHGTDTARAFDRILVAIGRTPNGLALNADAADIKVAENGFIAVDDHLRTSNPHIYAIGDVIGQPMLAHKALFEGKLAAEHIAGISNHGRQRLIPAVAYTDPEVAWVGMSEQQAREQGIEYDIAQFPWNASGRALTMHNGDGLTRLIVNTSTGQVIGAGIVGQSAGDLISEITLVMESGLKPEDVTATVHPHPTLSETVVQAAEISEGSITDLYMSVGKAASA